MSLSSHYEDTISARIEFAAGTSNSLTLCNAEARIARAMISDAEHALDSIEFPIAQPLENREKTKAHLHRLRVAIAPHKRLPTELLAEIFVYAHGGADASLPPRRGTTPWNVRGTCASWRDIVMNDRRVWKRIVLDLQLDRQTQKAPDVTTLATLVNSVIPSSRLPSISMNVSGCGSIDSIIVPTFARATDIKLHAPQSSVMAFLRMPSKSLPSIERLELHVPDDFPTRSFRMAEIFNHASCLREIHLYGQCEDLCQFEESEEQNDSRLMELAEWTGGKDSSRGSGCLDYTAFLGSFHWGQLTHVNILRCLQLKPKEAFNILRQCTRLTHCALKVIVSIDEDEIPGAVTLPHLRNLTLSTDDNITLDLFTAPSLTTLYVGSLLLPIDEAAALISRSQCRLASFAHEPIGYEVVQSHSTLRLISLLPGLVELCTPTLRLTVPASEMIGRRELLPILEVLECSGAEACEIDAFTELLESRIAVLGTGQLGLREACLHVEEWNFSRLDKRWWEAYNRFRKGRGDAWASYAIRQVDFQ